MTRRELFCVSGVDLRGLNLRALLVVFMGTSSRVMSLSVGSLSVFEIVSVSLVELASEIEY